LISLLNLYDDGPYFFLLLIVYEIVFSNLKKID